MGDTMTWKLTADGDEAVVDVYDSPGEGRTAKDFTDELAALKNRRLLVTINSAAGDATEGLDIYDALRKWKGELRTFTTFAGGGALLIALAADKPSRLVAPDGLFFLQQPVVSRVQDVTDLGRFVRTATVNIAGVLTDQVGWDDGTWIRAMGQNMWWPAKLAIEDGFAGAIVNAEELQQVTRAALTPQTRRPITAKTPQSEARGTREQRRGAPIGAKELGMAVRKAQT